jgi:hypothetical protein
MRRLLIAPFLLALAGCGLVADVQQAERDLRQAGQEVRTIVNELAARDVQADRLAVAQALFQLRAAASLSGEQQAAALRAIDLSSLPIEVGETVRAYSDALMARVVLEAAIDRNPDAAQLRDEIEQQRAAVAREIAATEQRLLAAAAALGVTEVFAGGGK